MFVDWVQCTFSDPSGAVKEWIQGSLRGQWISVGQPHYQYTHTLNCGGVTMHLNKPGSDNIRLVIGGRGCRELEGAGAVSSWAEFLARLLRSGAKFSRLDAAIDDHDGILSMDAILLCCKEGRVVSRYKKIMPYEPLCSTTGRETGKGASFGDRSSKTMVRIYDKALQEQTADHWIRVEMEAHDKKAQALAQSIAEGVKDVVPRTLLSYLDFKVRGGTERRERWVTEEWWTRFLGTTERFHLETAPRDESLEKSYRWLLRCVSRMFARVYHSEIGKNIVVEMLSHGTAKQDREAKHKEKPPKAAQKQQEPQTGTA